MEKRLINVTSENEKDRAVLNQKFANLEQEREKLIATYEGEIQSLRDQNDALGKNFEDSKSGLLTCFLISCHVLPLITVNLSIPALSSV